MAETRPTITQDDIMRKQALLLDMQLAEFNEKLTKKQRDSDIQLEARKRQAKADEAERQKNENNQKYCLHIIMNGPRAKSNLVGQRHPQGTMDEDTKFTKPLLWTLRCQKCQAKFTNNKLPPNRDIMPTNLEIGGPNF